MLTSFRKENKNNDNKRYLFYVTLSYSFSVLRPIEKAIKKAGGVVAWFIPKGSEAENFLLASDRRLLNVKQVKEFEAHATLAPGNFIPDFFSGIKVQVFHGLDSGKKNKFNIRGFFDLYCTQGPNITNEFNKIADGTCEIIETGWSKLDPLFTTQLATKKYQVEQLLILYAPTFSPKLTSTYALYPHIKKLSEEKNWQWIVKLHPKATSEEVSMYKALTCKNLRFIETGDIIPILQAADVIVSDTSSVLTEFSLQGKLAIAFNSRCPEPWMLNFQQAHLLEKILLQAFSKNKNQMKTVIKHGRAIHPYRDGLSSERVLDAIDNLIHSGIGNLKTKPFNLIRRLKIRKKLRYYRWK
jgi:hypothetical protein